MIDQLFGMKISWTFHNLSKIRFLAADTHEKTACLASLCGCGGRKVPHIVKTSLILSAYFHRVSTTTYPKGIKTAYWQSDSIRLWQPYCKMEVFAITITTIASIGRFTPASIKTNWIFAAYFKPNFFKKSLIFIVTEGQSYVFMNCKTWDSDCRTDKHYAAKGYPDRTNLYIILTLEWLHKILMILSSKSS